MKPTNDDYWEVHGGLVDSRYIEKGRGAGGSVYRLVAVDEPLAETVGKGPKKKKWKESELYAPFEKYLRLRFVKQNNLKLRSAILEQTANQGRKRTGGKLTRPDFAIVAVKSYRFVPGKTLDLITFEIKPTNDFRIDGVLQTAVHTRFATKSYLAILISSERMKATEKVHRIEKSANDSDSG